MLLAFISLVVWSTCVTLTNQLSNSKCVGLLRTSVREGQRPGTVIYKFSRRPNAVYSFTNDYFSSSARAIFRISPEGVVSNSVTLDYEDPRGSHFTLTVLRKEMTLRDKTSKTTACSLKITLQDTNDNTPKFPKDLYVGNIEENAPIGSLVQGLEGIYAVDEDSGINSVVSYKVLPRNGADDYFEAITEENAGLKFLAIKTRKLLDREDISFFVLTVEATDGGEIKQTTTTQLRINVLDVNDCSPVFKPSEYSVSVPSSAPITTSILKVHAQDDDLGANSEIYYYFKTTTQNFFTINPYTGVIRVSRGLEYAGRLLWFDVVAEDRGTPRKKASTVVKINIHKDNQRSMNIYPSLPVRFAKRVYLIRVLEDMPVKSHIFHANVMHLTGTPPRFSILSDHPVPFEVDANSSVVYLTRSLDYETTKVYEFQLRASVRQSNSYLDQATVRIEVNDVDENLYAPVFNRANLAASLQRRSSSRRRQLIEKLKASDKDKNANGLLKYYIRSGSGIGMLSIDESSGELYLKSGINLIDFDRLEVTVEARDSAKHWKSAKQFLVVDIVGPRDCSPEFARSVYNVSLQENQPSETFVVVARAQDCAGRKVNYSITAGNVKRRFTIGKQTGIVRTRRKLNREEQDEYMLEITAQSYTTSKAQVIVKIEDINDHKPVFASKNYQIHITENRGKVENLLCLVARDRDSGENGTVRYSIKEGNDKNLFKINPNTGTLSSGSLNFEDQKEHILVIRATDHGKPPLSDTTVKVIVTDINDPPRFMADDIEVSILEEKPIGSTVVLLSVSDEDTGINGEYICSYENIDENEFGKFEVKTTKRGCEVQNIKILDWFQNNIYSLKVHVTDKAPANIRKSDSITVTIKIEDINNHAPEFTQDSYWVSVPEDTPLFTSTILQPKATDKDSGLNADISYAITNQTETIFLINSKDGSITINRKLSIGKYEIIVTAKDKGSPERRQHVSCFVSVYSRRTIFPPKISGNFYRKLSEDTRVSTVVTTVRLRGKRQNRNVVYSIVGGNIDMVFDIKKNGAVRVVRSLDYERVQEYKLIVRVVYTYHRRDLAIEIPLKVQVLDVNDNKPSFALTNHPLVIDINKRLSSGKIIAQVSAFDADSGENGEVRYSIKKRSDPGYFSIHPTLGTITVTKPLASRYAPYTFTMIAEDRGTPRKQSGYDVQVRIHKDSKPLRFGSGKRDSKVDEGPSGINTKTTTFRAKHQGENDVVYSILTGNDHNAFCVDVTGTVYSIRELDRESRARYDLNISASDGESSAFATLNIPVNDRNDNSPHFTFDPIRVFTKENARAQKIGTVNATDKDWGENGRVRYEIVSTSSEKNKNMFGIGAEDGALIITGVLDHEETPVHVLTVAAVDQGLPSRRTFARVIITVVDENDHSPRFLSRSFAENIPFNAPQGYPVLQTLATDQDSTFNSEIRYNIHSTSGMFTIDESTGWISVASGLSLGTVSFLVSATDKGIPERNDTARVTLTVEAGAGPPRFVHVLPRGFHASVAEDRDVGDEVLTVTAASRGLVSYAIDDVSIKDFLIDETTGKITIAQPLDFERRQRYDFTVTATDRNDRGSTAHVSIAVVNINDNKPRILNKVHNEIFCRILQHAKVGTVLTKIVAEDNDTNDSLHYSLTTNQTYFSIDSLGYIKTKALLRDVENELYFGVTVSDSGHPPLQDAAVVRVVLLNYDLTQSRASQIVSEALPPGQTIVLSPKIYRATRRSRFSIVYPQSPPFTVQPIKGNLVLKEPLDYEVQAKYSLTVRIGEKSKPKDYVDVDVTVLVKDENDNPPEFKITWDSTHLESVHKNARQGTLIHHFKATDKDSGSNGEVEFRMGQKYQGLFQLGRKTGELTTTGVTLEIKTYNVSIVAYDIGTPSLSTRTYIMVNADIMKPEFSEKEYEFDVNENATIGQYVGVIKANSFGVLLTYQLIERDTPFSINPNNGILTLLKPVDHEKIKQRVFKLVVVAKTQETSRTTVTIRVNDINDCAPKFDIPRYMDTVPESAPIGTTVLRVHATDQDSGLNAEIRYSLDNDDFIIDPYTGMVTTAVVLDYEMRPLYKMNVMAHDRGTPRLMGTAQLIVNITNVNDNVPVFTSSVYSSSLWENARKGSLVTTVRATDADEDTIIYDITAGNDASVFVINPATGVIKVSNDPSVSLVGPSYHLNVSASDGLHKGQAVVIVNIKDINDHAPVFSECDRYSPSIPEGSPAGTTVLRVHATDEDLGSNGKVEYAIIHPHSLFQIDRKTGVIETAAALNRKDARSYSIRVKATDGGRNMRADERRESSCLFTVTITDINNNKPIFSMRHYETSIKENVDIGHSVIQVQADDDDEGKNAEITYAFNPSTSYFHIDSQTGVITTQANLVNKNQVYKLRVTATDNGEPRSHSEADVTVNVIDSSNNPPQFEQSFYEVTVPEDIRRNSKVIRVRATPDKVYYRIIPGNVPATNNPRKFVIDATRGVVQVQGGLDRETTPNYTLTIEAENDENPPLRSWTILRILVTDVNDCPPEFTFGEYEGRVPENSDPGTSVLTVRARDRDNSPYNKTIYTISGGNQYFSIEKSTGVIRSKVVFDRENINRYKFAVKATDEENPGLYNDVIVTVLVTDVNDWSPKFDRRHYRAEVYENAVNGTKVETVSASDKDQGLNAKIRFHIDSGNDNDKFRIDPDSGRVEVNGQLDYEQGTEYNLTISAWDGLYKDTAIMTVIIKNENDNKPRFEAKDGVQEADVPENSPPGTIVTNVTAIDRDYDSRKFTKKVKYDLSDKVDGIFRIDPETGVITTEIGLDRETKDTYIFEAYAHDGYGKSGSIEVIVHVRDVNDHEPTFSDYRLVGVVHENMPPGSFVKEVKAQDDDDENQGGNAVIKYHLQSNPNNAFTIEEDTGKIRTQVKLDREDISKYVLVVNATDGGQPPLSSTVEVTVHVLDKNDHAPKFDMKEFEKSIPENTSLGSVVLRLGASDDDIGRNARKTFSLVNNVQGNDFKINARTGDIIVESSLDYEKKTSYEFKVKVQDQGIPPKSDTAKVIIRLQDSNDKAPYFNQDYSITLPEGPYNNKKLLKVQAYDDDTTAINKHLNYSISGGDSQHVFHVDSITGELFVISALDYETTPRHVIRVRATNTAPPNLYGETEVKISLTDINDNPPELTNSSMNLHIFENLPRRAGRVIGTLQPTDGDTAPNAGPFTFGIRGESEIFQLDWKTGVLTTNTTFDRERQPQHLLEVWVRDSGNPPLTNNITVTINVLDRNDNQHDQGHLELTVNLMARQSISPNIPVGRVFVYDEDTNDLRYYDMLSGDMNTFYIERTTGNIFMKQRPLEEKYTFRVKVSDQNSSFYPVISTVRIKVNEISTEAFTKSVSLRFLDMNQEDFIKYVQKYKKVIGRAVNTRPENVDLFSVQNAGGGSFAVDVMFAAHGSPYYDPGRLIGLLKAKRHHFGRNQKVIIGYDACASEPCKNGGCRSNVVMTGEIKAIDDGFGLAFGSVTTKTEVKCGKCEELYTIETRCDPKICLNQSCVEKQYVFDPSFPVEQSDHSCGLSTRSFTKGDWIWLRSLRSCRDMRLSLEFSTLRENGLLLYNGPGAEPGTGENYDFIVIQFIEGKIAVGFSLGERAVTNLVMTKSSKLNDGKWHLVEVVRNNTLVRVTVDRCRSSSVQSFENKDIEDRSNCETTWVISNTKFNVLDVNEPLQIGGVSSQPPNYTDVRTTFYDGCIRNVKENDVMFDLKDVLNMKGSRSGCPNIDKYCAPSPCHGAAKCVPSRNGFSCTCPPGYQGWRCDVESVSESFSPPSFIKYQLTKTFLRTYNPKFTRIEMMVRTRDENGGILMTIRDKYGSERLTIRLVDESKLLALEATVNLGNSKHVVQLKNALPQDGQWHRVILARDRDVVHLGIDPSRNPRKASGKGNGNFIVLNMAEDSEILVGGEGDQGHGKEYLDGCIKDVRINGHPLPINITNNFAKRIKLQGVTKGCLSLACEKAKCSSRQFCNDMWRKHQCLYRPCNSHPCHNGATCVDEVIRGIASFHCVCRPGFNGTRCTLGASVIKLTGDEEKINLKLVIGLSCFVFVLALATLLVICYHRYQTKGKATFDAKLDATDGKKGKDDDKKGKGDDKKGKGDDKKGKRNAKKGKRGDKKGLIIIDGQNNSPKTTITNPSYPSMYSSKSQIHTCDDGEYPAVPPRNDSLQTNGNLHPMEIPVWDIPPQIEVVLSPDSLSNEEEEDYIEDEDSLDEKPCDYNVESPGDELSWDMGDHETCYTSPEDDPKQPSATDRGFKVPPVSWNDIEEFGRKFYTITRDFLGKDDETRSNSGLSTTSNSSSVVTVVENQRELSV